jgi:quinol monooxygenase YgiN
VLNIRLVVDEGKHKELIQAVRELMATLRGEKGFRNSLLCQDTHDPEAFSLTAEWDRTVDLERYLASEGFRTLMGALKVLCSYSEVTYPVVAAGGGRVVLES